MKAFHSHAWRPAVVAAVWLLCLGSAGCSGDKVRNAANRASVQNEMKQLVLGLIKTADDNDGLMPPAENGATDKYGDVSWRLAFLRNIEEFPLYTTQIKGKNPLEASPSSALLNARPKTFSGANLVKDPTHTPYRVF